MYGYVIEGLVNRLAEKNLLSDVKTARKVMEAFWRDQIALIWTVTDVHSAANMIGYKVSDSEARMILDGVLHDFDAEYGVSWNTLQNAVRHSGMAEELTEEEKAHGDMVKKKSRKPRREK